MDPRPTVPDVIRVLILGLAPTHPDEPGANGGPALVGTHAGRLLAALAGLASDDQLPQHYTLRNIWEDPVDCGADLTAGRDAVTAMMIDLQPEVVIALGAAPANMLHVKTTWFESQWASVGRRRYVCHAMPKPTAHQFWADAGNRHQAYQLLARLRGEGS